MGRGRTCARRPAGQAPPPPTCASASPFKAAGPALAPMTSRAPSFPDAPRQDNGRPGTRTRPPRGARRSPRPGAPPALRGGLSLARRGGRGKESPRGGGEKRVGAAPPAGRGDRGGRRARGCAVGPPPPKKTPGKKGSGRQGREMASVRIVSSPPGRKMVSPTGRGQHGPRRRVQRSAGSGPVRRGRMRGEGGDGVGRPAAGGPGGRRGLQAASGLTHRLS